MLKNRDVNISNPEKIEIISDSFQKQFGSSPDMIVRCPGRVNLIGEHTDYNDGFVLPIALPFETVIAACPSADAQMNLISEEFGPAHFSLEDNPMSTSGWGRYIHAMGTLLAQSNPELLGWNGYICSSIPIGANLSSSAALEIAAGMVFKHFGGLEVTHTELALIGQRVENEFIGVRSGIMDQMACALSQRDTALLIDCLTLETSMVSIPEDATVVIMDTGTRRELRSSEYNRRRESCESAALELGVTSLRNASLEDITNLTDETLKRRARHVVSENGRVLNVVKAFSISDSFTAGQLFSDSHLSLRDDYDVSGPALNQIVEVALGAPGCFGARMTGGGFAGSAVALVDRNEVNNFCDFVKTNFTAPKAQPAITSVMLYPVEACDGVSVLKPN
jgi:galactokinase